MALRSQTIKGWQRDKLETVHTRYWLQNIWLSRRERFFLDRPRDKQEINCCGWECLLPRHQGWRPYSASQRYNCTSWLSLTRSSINWRWMLRPNGTARWRALSQAQVCREIRRDVDSSSTTIRPSYNRCIIVTRSPMCSPKLEPLLLWGLFMPTRHTRWTMSSRLEKLPATWRHHLRHRRRRHPSLSPLHRAWLQTAT